VFPPVGLSFKWYTEIAKRPEFIESVIASSVVAICTSIIATVLGTVSAIALVRFQFFGLRVLQAIFLAPLSLPGLIFGLALLQFLSTYGLARNLMSMTVAHIIITMPFTVRFVSVALTGLDRNIELAAQSLGADRFRTFLYVTLPLIRPGVVASFVFSLILSFDEVGASLFLASPSATTLPVRIFVYIDQNYDPLMTSVSSLLVFAAVAALVVIERTAGMGRLFGLR
jgi:putative spermidine/putrescine transport system permease protein